MHPPAPNPLVLEPMPGRYAVCRGTPTRNCPAAPTGEFLSVTRSGDELSIVCGADVVPAGFRCESDWRMFRIGGAIPFGQLGVIAGLTQTLAAAEISVFVISTFDTDYILVPETRWDEACRALRGAGYRFRDDLFR